jgi:hypothetical protein
MSVAKSKGFQPVFLTAAKILVVWSAAAASFGSPLTSAGLAIGA